MGTERRDARRNAGRLIVGSGLLVSLAVAGASLPLESQALVQARRDAVDRAIDLVDAKITPELGASRTAPLSSLGPLHLDRLARRASRDGFTRFLLWSLAGDLIYTSGQSVGRVETPPEVSAAAGGSIESSLTGRGDRRTLAAYVAVPAGRDPITVAQVDQRFLPIETSVHDRWTTIRAGAGGAAAFFLAATLLAAARGRLGKRRTQGGFSPERTKEVANVPSGGSGSKATEQMLQRSEQARQALEEQLGQLRTQAAETEARSAERARVFGAQVADAEARVKELEGMLRDAEGRASRSEREAPFVEAVEEHRSSDARVASLEQQLVTVRAERDAAQARIAELEPLLAQTAARVEHAETEASRGAMAADARAQRSEARMEELERQLAVSKARVAEMEAFTAETEQRLAASADAEGRSSLRIRELEGRLEAALRDSRTAELEAELADAHHAGKEAMRMAAQSREELRSTRDELVRARAELELLRGRAGTDDVTGDVTGDATERADAPLEDAPTEPARTEPETSGDETPADDEPDDEEVPSLRYRLTHSAAKRKGRATRPDEAWSSPAWGG